MGKKTPQHPLTAWDVLKQAVSDWFGKEVQTGYTLTYVWMANQFGHFNIGFLGTTLFTLLLTQLLNPALSVMVLYVSSAEILIWVIKETYDYFDVVRKVKNNSFPLVKSDVFKDALTAVYFITLGIACSALVLVVPGYYPFLGFLACIVLILYPSYYWLVRKMYFQQAGLPFQYRLSSFPLKLSKNMVNEILNFTDKTSGIQHLLITGGKKSGKTSLATGIGTEFTFDKGVARYLTYFKYLQVITINNEPDKHDGRILWNWRKSSLLIIDDVDPGVGPEIVTPQSFLNILNSCDPEVRNKNITALKNQNTVWVLGTNENDEAEQWKTMLLQLGVGDENEIGHIDLPSSLAL